MVRHGLIASFLAFAVMAGTSTVEGTKKGCSKEFTIYERGSADGPRHSPLFSLPTGEGEFPSKMLIFNNDLYDSADNLLDDNADYSVGFDQGYCVETVYTESGFTAECFVTYVLTDAGTITANGPFTFDGEDGVLDSVLAVTGGTGDYKGAKGEAALKAGPAEFPSLRFDFDIRVRT